MCGPETFLYQTLAFSGSRNRAELATNLREDFIITEKAPIKAFTWLNASTSPLKFKTLLRHYAKQAPKHGK